MYIQASTQPEDQQPATGATTATSYDEMLRIKAKQKLEHETAEDAAKAVEAGVDPAVASLHATIKNLYR